MNSVRKVPYATISLAALITIIQILNMIYPFEVWSRLTAHWKFLYNQPWRVVSSFFIHSNIYHYIGGLFILCLVGWYLEPKVGPGRLLGVLFGAMVTAHVLRINLLDKWAEGVTFGVSGLFGLSLITNRRTPWWTTMTNRPVHLIYLLFMAAPLIPFVHNLLGFLPEYPGHLAAILYGMLFGAAFILGKRWSRWRWAAVGLPILLFASVFYSPWKTEWRLSKLPPTLVTENADCRLSTIEEEIPAVLTFRNQSDQAVAGYLLTFMGDPRFEFVLPPGEETGYYVYLTHAWCIVDIENREALQAVVVTEPEQTVIIH